MLFSLPNFTFGGGNLRNLALSITTTLVVSAGAIAQNTLTVQGVVKDVHGEVLVGVNVRVKGSSQGVATDLTGKYRLSGVSKGSILEFSYVGMQSQSIRVDRPGDLNVVLRDEAQALSAVVVTALGIKRSEKALSYSVQQIKQEELIKVKSPNFVNSLNGKIAGVNINKSGSGIGGATRVVMRGEKSFEGSNNALYVVDGIPLFNQSQGTDSGAKGEGRVGSEGIADFNPEDIESISVLSGPSAAALYGSNATNGVILITTKKGKEGKLEVSLTSSSEFSSPLIMPKFQRRYGNKPGKYESWGDRLDSPSSYDPARDFFRRGTNFVNAVTLTTGTKHNQTFLSIASTNARGLVPNNTYERYNFTARNTSMFAGDKLQLDLGASYIKQRDNNMVSQGEYYNPIMAAYLYPRGEDFDKIKTFERYDNNRAIHTQYWPLIDGVYAPQNPYWTAYRNLAPNDKDRFMFNAGLSYKPWDWLNLSARARLDRTYLRSERRLYASTDGKYAEPKGYYEYANYRDSQFYSDFIATLNKGFGDFALQINAGGSFSDYWSLEEGFSGNLVLIPNLFSVNNIATHKGKAKEKGGDTALRNASLFTSAELSYRQMLYLTLTSRTEWNSRLVNSKEFPFHYPSVGLSAVISEMVKMPKFLPYLKLRASFSEVGAPIAWSGRTPGTITTPISGGKLAPTNIYPASEFRAERTRSYEFGLSARLLSKLSLEATWYKSNTYNQSFESELPESSGYEKIYLQAGDVQNSGIELSLTYNDKFGDFGLNSSLTFSRNVNVIKEMVRNYIHPFTKMPFNIDEVTKDNGRTRLRVGGSISDIYATKVLKKDNQGYVNIPESGEISIDDKIDPIKLGRTTPDFMLAWGSGISYKGFALSFLFNARVGGVVTSSTQALLDKFGVSEASALARDRGGVTLGVQGLYDAEKFYNLTKDLNAYHTYSATNVRLQELSLSYSLPSQWLGRVFKGATLTLFANNLWMLYNKAPHDPELSPSTGTYGQGNDYFMQPSTRSLGFSVKLKI